MMCAKYKDETLRERDWSVVKVRLENFPDPNYILARLIIFW